MATSTNNVSQQANLLACKQWWKVCFLHGDQQKYYRQVYGKAAAERLAIAKQQTKESTASAERSNASPSATPPSLFPVKNSSRRRSKMSAEKSAKSATATTSIEHATMPDLIKPNSRVTVLDDPFLFGLDTAATNEHLANLSGEDSGIDNAAFDSIIGCTTSRGALSPNRRGPTARGDPNPPGLPPRLPEKRVALAGEGPPYNQLGIAAADSFADGGCASGAEAM